MQAFTDAMALIGSLLAMVLVIVFTYYATRWYAGRMGRAISGRHIKIIDKTTLGPGQMLFIVQAGEKFYLLGTGEKSVRLICELQDFALQPLEPPPPETNFPKIFRDFVAKAAKSKSHKDGGDQE